jgi:hypothetical protein
MAKLNKNPISILLKRGNSSNINVSGTILVGSQGEPHYASDNRQLYIHDGKENHLVSNLLPYINVNFSGSPYFVDSRNSYNIRADCTSGTIILNLRALGTGHIIFAKKIDSSGNVVIVSGTIDGNPFYTISGRYSAVEVQDIATGSWDIIGKV